MDTNLTQYYDTLKNKLADDTPTSNTLINVGTNMSHPGAVAYIKKAQKECDHLTDDCRKHVILDIYCKILPLDDDFKHGHHGQMKHDIDCMLANKGMNATQYITSCHESTHAPLLDFIMRATDGIGRGFMEDAKETLKDAQENEMDIPAPEAPNIEDDEVNDQLVDVTNDMEYDSFVDQLKQKTIDKIVSDVSEIIAGKKEEDDMTFKSEPTDAVAESTVSIALDYLNTSLMKENTDLTPELQEDMIGMAIREATMNFMDCIFKQPASDFKSYRSRILLGKGNIINESAANYFVESGNQRFEPLYKEVDGNKYDVSNYEKIDKDGKKTPMTDQEAKKVLDPDGYKGYQNKNKN